MQLNAEQHDDGTTTVNVTNDLGDTLDPAVRRQVSELVVGSPNGITFISWQGTLRIYPIPAGDGQTGYMGEFVPSSMGVNDTGPLAGIYRERLKGPSPIASLLARFGGSPT